MTTSVSLYSQNWRAKKLASAKAGRQAQGAKQARGAGGGGNQNKVPTGAEFLRFHTGKEMIGLENAAREAGDDKGAAFWKACQMRRARKPLRSISRDVGIPRTTLQRMMLDAIARRRRIRYDDDRYRRRGELQVIVLDAETLFGGVDELNRGKNGRPFIFGDEIFKAIAIYRVATGAKWRQIEGMLKRLAAGRFRVPVFGHIRKRIERLSVSECEGHITIGKDGPKYVIHHILIDGSGMRSTTRSAYRTDKYGNAARGYHKVVVATDADTNRSLAVEVLDEKVGDSPALLNKMVKKAFEYVKAHGDMELGDHVIVSSDGGFDGNDSHRDAAEGGYDLNCPAKKNSAPKAPAGRPARAAPGAEKPGAEKPGAEKPGAEKPGAEKPGAEKPGAEKPGGEKPGGEKPGGEKPGGEKPGGEKPGGEKPGGEKPGGEKPGGEKPGGEKPGGEKPGGEKPGGEKPGGEKPGGEKPGGEKPGGEKPGGEKPGGEKPGGEKPGGEKPGGEKPGGEKMCDGEVLRHRAVLLQQGAIANPTPEDYEAFRNLTPKERWENTRQWAIESGYTLRNKIEAWFGGVKGTFGDGVLAKKPSSVKFEVECMISIYNHMIDDAVSRGYEADVVERGPGGKIVVCNRPGRGQSGDRRCNLAPMHGKSGRKRARREDSRDQSAWKGALAADQTGALDKPGQDAVSNKNKKGVG